MSATSATLWLQLYLQHRLKYSVRSDTGRPGHRDLTATKQSGAFYFQLNSTCRLGCAQQHDRSMITASSSSSAGITSRVICYSATHSEVRDFYPLGWSGHDRHATTTDQQQLRHGYACSCQQSTLKGHPTETPPLCCTRLFVAREHVIGWYSTGPRLREADLSIHQLMTNYCSQPILCICEVEVGVITLQVTVHCEACSLAAIAWHYQY